MADLARLIERVGKLTGPDRDVEWYIEKAIVRPEDFPDVAIWPPFAPGSKFDKSIPFYTASLDAAMALAVRLLDNGSIDIECAYRVAAGQPLGRAYICGPHAESSAKAATPAIALLIATLRALQSQEADILTAEESDA